MGVQPTTNSEQINECKRSATLDRLERDWMIKQYHELGLVSDICLDKTYKAGTIKFKSRNPRFKWEQEFRIRRKNPRMLFVSPAPQFTGYM
jgi:hypothetical protein